MVGKKSCSWVSLEASCKHCIALIRQGLGIFCANFGKPVLGLPLCHRAWCVPCYHQQPGTDFLVYTDRNVTMAPIPNEENNYIQAHKGGSLFCPYECDECSFHRITGSPSLCPNINHQRLLNHIRRANLDAFWPRAKGTVRELKRFFF